MLTKHMKKKFDSNCTRMLWAVLNKSWRHHSTKQQLYGHLPTISKTIQIRWARHAGHCWRRKDKLISNVHLWTPSHRRARVGWPVRTYLLQLCIDTGCSMEDLLRMMKDRDKWREKVREICVSGMWWWWWWWCIYIYIYIYIYINKIILWDTTNRLIPDLNSSC